MLNTLVRCVESPRGFKRAGRGSFRRIEHCGLRSRVSTSIQPFIEIAAAADRLSVHPNAQFSESPSGRRVRLDVNRLKHDIKQDHAQRSTGLLAGRDVSMAVALSAFRAT